MSESSSYESRTQELSGSQFPTQVAAIAQPHRDALNGSSSANGSKQNTAAEQQPSAANWLAHGDNFVQRHIGPESLEIQQMLELLGFSSLEALIANTIPQSIRQAKPLQLGESRSEYELLGELKAIASQNQIFRSFIGMGYSGCITPPVIGRNILENPGWYTQYTPYQPEIAQGRLEALLNFQTMIIDMTGLPIANASLLDEATAAAEAMAMCHAIADAKKTAFFVSADCHPQTIAVVQTRARSMGIECIVGKRPEF